ncbi:MAG: 3-dehydroquinate synthase [Actinobacteria bacterium]|uniref:3-dehydroquinate synthase n=1 Tax=freshwater metagenome TaxID=449393 RepID=A0A6J6HKQ2_9ZZZZ|nr:3-dehydroquinate synthase [Actinomycetota bacterium]
MANTTTISVKGDNSYDVVIGRALLDEVALALDKNVAKVLIVHPVGLSASAETLRESLIAKGFEAILAGVPDSEDAKRVEVAAFCWGIMGQSDFTRTDAVIGFGGGSTTDLAGFVAATWLRGVKLIQVPTTLLGMVDAAIGGKTGINTSEGKNLVGVFHAPSKVIIDLDTLLTLPKNEILAGFGEVVKYGFIADPRILEIIESSVDIATDPTSAEFQELIERSVAIKARVVSEDFKEAGLREILNYGHTLGHAIEHAERYKWRHGAAISIGMVFVAELARLAGRLGDDVVDRHRSVLKLIGLPTSYSSGKWNQLVETMQRDKKSRAGTLRFVVLDDLAKPTIMTAPTPEMLFAAFQEVVDD